LTLPFVAKQRLLILLALGLARFIVQGTYGRV
jgi:hypothetical protein